MVPFVWNLIFLSLFNFVGVHLRPAFYFFIICVHVCMCTTCMSGAEGGHTRVSEPLEPEFQVALSPHVGAVNSTQVLCSSIKCCQPLSRSPAPISLLFKDILKSFECNFLTK